MGRCERHGIHMWCFTFVYFVLLLAAPAYTGKVSQNIRGVLCRFGMGRPDRGAAQVLTGEDMRAMGMGDLAGLADGDLGAESIAALEVHQLCRDQLAFTDAMCKCAATWRE